MIDWCFYWHGNYFAIGLLVNPYEPSINLELGIVTLTLEWRKR